jgi:hypothetical protein
MIRCVVDGYSLPSRGLKGFSLFFNRSQRLPERAATVGVCLLLPETRRQMRIGTLENCVLGLLGGLAAHGLGYSYSPGERNHLFIRPVRF